MYKGEVEYLETFLFGDKIPAMHCVIVRTPLIHSWLELECSNGHTIGKLYFLTGQISLANVRVVL